MPVGEVAGLHTGPLGQADPVERVCYTSVELGGGETMFLLRTLAEKHALDRQRDVFRCG